MLFISLSSIYNQSPYPTPLLISNIPSHKIIIAFLFFLISKFCQMIVVILIFSYTYGLLTRQCEWVTGVKRFVYISAADFGLANYLLQGYYEGKVVFLFPSSQE